MTPAPPARYKAIAAYYDAEYDGVPMLQQDVPFFLGQMPTRRQSVLELCVGTGRAAMQIARAGHQVTGVDYDKALLEIAATKLSEFRPASPLQRGPNLAGKVQFIHADAKSIALGKRFDWVCIFFNTLLAFPTIAELDQLLGVVRAHLKPRGRLWVDIFNPDLARLGVPKTTGMSPRSFFVPALNRTVFSTADIEVDPVNQLQQVTFHYQWFDARGRRHRERVQFGLTWLFPRELSLLMERNGLRVETSFGNYDGSPVTADSPRIIARCALS